MIGGYDWLWGSNLSIPAMWVDLIPIGYVGSRFPYWLRG